MFIITQQVTHAQLWCGQWCAAWPAPGHRRHQSRHGVWRTHGDTLQWHFKSDHSYEDNVPRDASVFKAKPDADNGARPDRHRVIISTIRAGARFTNGPLPATQIRWKLCLTVIPLLAIRSRQNFAHATTAQLSCHVQNPVAITPLDSRWERNTISIETEPQWKSRLWNGALISCLNPIIQCSS